MIDCIYFEGSLTPFNMLCIKRFLNYRQCASDRRSDRRDCWIGFENVNSIGSRRNYQLVGALREHGRAMAYCARAT